RYFFFQAEDGIRDFHVTGVQTCALPILDMFLQAVVDAALVAQNAAVAAESLGLGICMIGGIRNDPVKVAELLKLPPRTFALVGKIGRDTSELQSRENLVCRLLLVK